MEPAMTVPPNSGLTLTTHGTSDQSAYHYISYANLTTLNHPVANTLGLVAVIGIDYGFPYDPMSVPHWTLVNYSAITGYSSGVALANGGLVDNHATTSSIVGQHPALGADGYGVGIFRSSGAVLNQGTINGVITGVYLGAGGGIVNGATNNAYASISGSHAGVTIAGSAGAITNYGSIEGRTGIYLADGGTVTNIQNVQQHFNDSLAANAAILGSTGAGIVVANAPGTIINNGGVIRGT
jgi:hypothetical protein